VGISLSEHVAGFTRQTRFSTDQRGHCSLIGWVDSLELVDFVEGAIGCEDCVDSAIDREGGEDGVLGVKALVGLEEVNSTLDVIWLDRMPPGQFCDAPGSLCCAWSVAGSPCSLVRQLLKQVDARLTLQITRSGQAYDLAAWLPIQVLSAQCIDEDRSVV
jgi:hypothetical protein